MSDSIPRYPLEWPFGWKRTPMYARRSTPFKRTETSYRNGEEYKRTVPLNHETAIRRLETELERLNATGVTLSTNVELRIDGRPRGDQKPSDPGVAVYFTFRKKPTVLACDTFDSVLGNIAAVAAHIESLRRIERYGVGTIEQALAGYKALPADTAADWRMVLFGAKSATVTADDVKAAHRRLSAVHHPDKGGDIDKMMQINRARDYALDELSA